MIPLVVFLVLAPQSLPPISPKATGRTIVLTYHDMVPVRDKKALWFDCTPKELDQQLDWLLIRGASFVSIDQLHRHLTTGAKLPPKPVAITFADNYLGFYELALPILRKRKIPVTMFVHTNHVGSKKGRPKMSWEQLEELDKEGLVTIASQTRSHPADLRTLSDEALTHEFTSSAKALASRMGHPIPYLAYPNGKFDKRVAIQAMRAGYRMAFTEDQKPAERAPNLFMVPRYVHTKYKEAWGDATR